MPITVRIQAGDSIVNVAFQNGFFAETIWKDPANAALRDKRPDMNILLPGDELVIPDKRPKSEEVATGRRHPFRIKGIPAIFALQVFEAEEPRSNQRYQLTVRGPSGVKEMEGETNADGVLRASIPQDAVEGELVIGPDAQRLILQFGHLDPSDELSGVQDRLQNLGLQIDDPAGQLGASTRDALRSFQQRFGLKVTGEPDDATRQKLEALNDHVGSIPERAS